MDRRELIIEKSTRIAELRKELSELEHDLDKLIAGSGTTERFAVPVTLAAANSVANFALADNILRLIRMNQGKSFDANQVLTQLGLETSRLPSIRSTLHRLAAEKRILKIGPGQFAALQKHQTGDASQSENHQKEVG